MVPEKNILLDEQQIHTLKKLFLEDFNSFVKMFFEDFEVQQKELSSAFQQNKLENIVKIAHSLKGSSLNMGAVSLANACYQLEVVSRRGNVGQALQEYDQLQKIYPGTKEMYLRLIN